jgi:sister chromatid cohesion protein PDS5
MVERKKRKENELKSLRKEKELHRPPVEEEEEEHLEEKEEEEDSHSHEEYGGEEKKEAISEKDHYGNEIFSTSYLGNAARKVELLSRIKILSETLKQLNEIGNKKKILTALSGQLNSKKLIGNQDREIRLLSAACILDILRLFAPDVPYSSEELCELFEAFTVMLRGFSTYDPNSALGSCLFYLLSSLSTVRSCAILVFLAQQNIPSANERLKEFIEALISSIRADHSEAVTGHIGNILETCIFESEKFDQEFLDILLAPLLPSSKTENPAAYHLSQSVLARCTSKLQPSISSFINHILVGGIQEVSHLRADESNLSEDVYTIIYEISKISPNYLLHILPNICIQLQAEESEMRLEVVKLLGKLFSSPHSNYGRDFLKSFKDYLRRFVDISTSIRIEMIESAYLIFVHHADLREYLEGPPLPPSLLSADISLTLVCRESLSPTS